MPTAVIGLLVGLVAVSTGLRLWAGLRVPSPWYTPDELVYGELGRSLYSLGRFEILGGTPSFYSLVYPALVGLPLNLSERELGYSLLKVLQAVVMSLTAVPVYLWGRTLMRPPAALAAAGLALAAPALAFTGFIMTEVVFYPVLTLAAWAFASALARPTLGNQALVVGAVLGAAMTRLQAIVLVPAFVLALGLKVAFERSWLRGVRPFAPALGALGVLAAGWLGTSSLSGGAALGAYTVTGEAAYSLADALRFSLYHAGDLVLVTAVLPVAALVVVAAACVAGRERSGEARAYVAVAASFSIVMVGAVGVFTSRFLGRLAERNLIALAPVLFLALGLWLDRGAPRPRIIVAVASVACLGLLLSVPWNDFVTAEAEPDALSLIPLFKLRTAYPDLDVSLIVAIGAVELLVAFAFLPRRFIWLVPVGLAALLASASVVVSDEVASKARGFRAAMVGADNRWIDAAAHGPVAYVYGNELSWSAGAPAWVNVFWNRRIEAVYALFDARIAGPMPARPVRPAADGRLLSPEGRSIDEPYAVLARRMTPVGDLLATTGNGMSLWRVRSPLQLSTRTSGLDFTGVVAVEGRFVVYDCRGGTLRLALRSPVDQTVDLLRDGKAFRTVRLRAGALLADAIPAVPPGSPGKCTFKILVESPLRAERLEFVRAS
jgi:dolichyl-phosphate-mannose-protein mannosyltransferase